MFYCSFFAYLMCGKKTKETLSLYLIHLSTIEYVEQLDRSLPFYLNEKDILHRSGCILVSYFRICSVGIFMLYRVHALVSMCI